MKKLLAYVAYLILLGWLAWLVVPSAQAQGVSPAQYCNGAAVYDTAVVGSTKLVSAPTVGGIYICGFNITSATTATVVVKLTYSTSGVVTTNTTGFNPLVTGAGQVALTPGWNFVSPVNGVFMYMVDHPATFNGLFVPNGNQLNITTSNATGPVQALVYFWTQNP